MRTLFFLTISAFLLAQHQLAQTAPGKPVTEAEKTGQKLFFQRCSVCHMGTSPAYRLYGPPLYDDVVKASGDDAVRKKIRDGSSAMPAWNNTFNPAEPAKTVPLLK